MPRTSCPERRAFATLTALLVLALATPACAGWVPNGNRLEPPIGVSPSDYFAAAADGASGLFVNYDAIAPGISRVLANGTVAAGWPVNPSTPHSLFYSHPVPDGRGGVYLASGSREFVRAFHLLDDGTMDPAWPADGLVICGITCSRSIPSAAPDGAGGMYVAWTDARHPSPANGNLPTELFVSRVTHEGTLATGWNDCGNLFGTIPPERPDTTRLSIGTVTPDGIRGVFVLAAYSVGGFSPGSVQHDDRFYQHVDPNGALTPGWPAGGLVPPDSSSGGFIALVADRGGCFAAWTRVAGGSAFSRVHRFLASGAPAPSWPADGVLLDPDTTRSVVAEALEADGLGGVTVAAKRDTAGGFAPGIATIQRFDATGSSSSGWPPGGVRIPAPPDTNYARTILLATDLDAGVYAVWTLGDTTMPPFGATALAALHLDASSAVAAGWPAAGLAVRDTAGTIRNPALLEDGRGGAYAVWNDHRGQGYIGDVYATRLGNDGHSLTSVPVATGPALHLVAAPNPFTEGTAVLFTLAAPTEVRLGVYDVNGREVRRLVSGTLPAGLHTSRWDGRDESSRRVSPGVYLIGGRIGDGSAGVRVLRVR